MITWLKKKLGWYKQPSYKGRENVEFSKLLFKGRSHGFTYYILDLGSHPTAYVKVGKKHPLYNCPYGSEKTDGIDVVHGGLTYSADHLCYDGKAINGWFFGWDYAHAGDRYAMSTYGTSEFGEALQEAFMSCRRLDDKSWKTQEIIEDAENICKRLSYVVK